MSTTTLVTETPSGEPVAGGGAFPDVYTLTETRARSGPVGLSEQEQEYGDQAAGSTAAISADGSTVAWLGMNVSEQVSSTEAQRDPQLPHRAAKQNCLRNVGAAMRFW